MVRKSQVQEHMEVLDALGRHLGWVDHLEGENHIRLSRTDPRAGGPCPTIPLDWISGLRGGRLLLDRSAEEARSGWQD